MSKSQGFLKEFWDNFEYLCSIALVVMAVVTFMNVFHVKLLGSICHSVKNW